jgi:hypothetical protein
MKTIAVATIVVELLAVAGSAAAAQQRAELMVGWLGYRDGTISQALGIRNHGLLPIRSARIRCRFFRNAKRLRLGSVDIKNIDRNAVGYQTMLVESPSSPDRAVCRIVSVRPQRHGDLNELVLDAAGSMALRG